MGPQRLGLLRVQWEANSIGPIKVSKQSLASQRQEGDNKAKHPNTEKDGDSSTPPGCQVAKRVDDADVFLQSEISEEEDGHFSGEHGQRADDLTLAAVHPGLSVSVILPSKLQVISPDHEEVDAHQPICTCNMTRPGFTADTVTFTIMCFECLTCFYMYMIYYTFVLLLCKIEHRWCLF